MNVKKPLALLGGLCPDDFMRRHWQKKPLLIRQAIPDMVPLLDRQALFELAAQSHVQSRLVQRKAGKWTMKSGPHAKLPSPKTSDWTLLVQGVDLHHAGAHALLQQFRFVPDARLDDLMISYASAGAGVGPHFDSYDVFLLQATGQRRWRIGPQKDLTLEEGVPLKILANFEPTLEVVLNPGDMLYLPPRYAHQGDAVGPDCMTYSIGFRAPRAGELARELLARLADEQDLPGDPPQLYADPAQTATASPAAVPKALLDFAYQAVQRAAADKTLLRQMLGEMLTEPKPDVWFVAGKAPRRIQAVRLDRQSRMMWDGGLVFLNGESWRMAGWEAKALRHLAEQRRLIAIDFVAKDCLSTWTSGDFHQILCDWVAHGWLHVD
jgi:50S ribosomal protein L16 3-hydroxylase